MVVAEVKLIVLSEIEIKASQPNLGIIGLRVRTFPREREIPRFEDSAGDGTGLNVHLMQVVKENGARLEQLLLLVGNEEERFVLASIIVFAPFAKMRNRQWPTDAAAKLLLGGRRNLTKSISGRQILRTIYIEGGAMEF